jgi:hypothetical protein
MKNVTNEQIFELLQDISARISALEEANGEILNFIDSYYQDMEEGSEMMEKMFNGEEDEDDGETPTKN